MKNITAAKKLEHINKKSIYFFRGKPITVARPAESPSPTVSVEAARHGAAAATKPPTRVADPKPVVKMTLQSLGYTCFHTSNVIHRTNSIKKYNLINEHILEKNNSCFHSVDHF